MNNITEQQPKMVLFVAGVYLVAPIVGKTLCKEDTTIGQNHQLWHYVSSPPVCRIPDEIKIPIAAVYGTSGDSAVFSVPLVT